MLFSSWDKLRYFHLRFASHVDKQCCKIIFPDQNKSQKYCILCIVFLPIPEDVFMYISFFYRSRKMFFEAEIIDSILYSMYPIMNINIYICVWMYCDIPFFYYRKNQQPGIATWFLGMRPKGHLIVFNWLILFNMAFI